jgi:tRNA threonylcarbamoyladenosine biosynthesis protein TsaE
VTGGVTGAELRLPTAADTRAFGVRLGRELAAGDLVVLAGPLGAGKTVLAQGIGEGLGVEGPVVSPTFVIAREHRPLGAGPWLVHVDAYRLGGPAGRAELEDLDLDLDRAAVVVEWGVGLAEGLADSHLLVELERPATGAPGDEPRQARISAVGERWDPVVAELAERAGQSSA